MSPAQDRKSDNLGNLTPVDLRDFWADEAQDFTPWLAREENLAILSEAIQMPVEGEIRTEVRAGPYRADIVVGDGESQVIIENQLGKTDHQHLGQLLVYATNHPGKTVVWIAKSFSDEYRNALDWLNDNTPSDIAFFGLEIELWRIGDSQPAPRFNVVCQPNQLTKIERSGASDGEIKGAKLAQMTFWEDLRALGEERGSKLSFRKPGPYHWYSMSVGRGGFGISLCAITTGEGVVRCELNVDNFEGEHEAFQLLKDQSTDIEATLGELKWRELPGKYSQVVKSLPGSILDDSKRPELLEWCLDSAEAFYDCFRPRIEKLDIAG